MDSSRKELAAIGYFVLAVLGLMLIIWGLFSALDLAFNGVNETGVVVKYEKHTGRGGVSHSHTLEIGEQVIQVTLEKRRKIGSEIMLQYVPNRPRTYWVKGNTGTPDLSALLGIVILIIGIIGFRDAKN